MAGLLDIEKELGELGVRIVAVSPDRPAKLAESLEEGELDYTLLSDSAMVAARALGLAWRVPDGQVESYRTKFGIDLEGDSGMPHHQLPVPAALLIDREGLVRHGYVNVNHRLRASPAILLLAAREMSAE